jgi:predicted alpha/beta-fold hydrolase
MSVTGHFWTLAAHLGRSWFRPVPPSPARAWATTIDDPAAGPVRLTGALTEPPGASAVIVVIHGLGGSADSLYVCAAARAAAAAGLACLRLNLRGADRRGEDVYHAGLIADPAAALESPEIAAYDSAALLGFSLGGHVALRCAALAPPPHLRAVAAICPPLDLAAAARSIDRPILWPYRRYLLRQLVEIYRATRHRWPRSATMVRRVERARTFVEFDSLVIAPRFGFEDAWDYYARMSVGRHLTELRIPGLVVAARCDPMIPAISIEPWLGGGSAQLESRWIARGGHLGFPPGADLELGRGGGPYPQIVSWLADAAGATRTGRSD